MTAVRLADSVMATMEINKPRTGRHWTPSARGMTPHFSKGNEMLIERERSRTIITWMTERHMPAVVAIEKASSSDPWEEMTIRALLRHKKVIGMVMEEAVVGPRGSEYKVRGYCVYRLHKETMEILKLAVDPAHRRYGHASAMLRKLRQKVMQRTDRHSIWMDVPEDQLPGHLFLQAHGVRATDVLRREECYRFCIQLKP